MVLGLLWVLVGRDFMRFGWSKREIKLPCLYVLSILYSIVYTTTYTTIYSNPILSSPIKREKKCQKSSHSFLIPFRFAFLIRFVYTLSVIEKFNATFNFAKNK